MNARRRTYIVALAGAAVLASGAYAIGTAQGGGSASAARSVAAAGPPPIRDGGFVDFRRGARGRPPGPPGAGLKDLADKLGVSRKELRAALRDVRPAAAPHGGSSELADALG